MSHVAGVGPGRNNVPFITSTAMTSHTMPSTHSTAAPMRKGSADPLRATCISSRTAWLASAPEPPWRGCAMALPVLASTNVRSFGSFLAGCSAAGSAAAASSWAAASFSDAGSGAGFFAFGFAAAFAAFVSPAASSSCFFVVIRSLSPCGSTSS